jgi:exonuclease VII small subunit
MQLAVPTLYRAIVASAILLIASSARSAEASSATVALTSAKGDVKVRGPKEKSYGALSAGAEIADGSRLRTGDDSEAALRFPDGTESTVRAKSEIIVHAVPAKAKEGNAIVLFFGRLWSHAAKAGGAEEIFEVRSANAVAGVRGTKFEVGVADDGSTRVIVSEGAVGVGGDDETGASQPVNVSAGYEIESNEEGRIAEKKKAAVNPDWEGWFSKRARQLERNGLKVARDLDGRLNKRKAKVEKLVAEQRTLRKRIEDLEGRAKGGASVEGELREALAKLEHVTRRLEDMKERLQGAFGLFERWGAIARKGGMDGADQMGKMADNISKIAADFADMIEEGTDLSEDGMNDMMDDMKKRKSGKPKKGEVKDELF